jgi:hypothetical protein
VAKASTDFAKAMAWRRLPIGKAATSIRQISWNSQCEIPFQSSSRFKPARRKILNDWRIAFP